MNIDKTHASLKGVRRRLFHQLYREAMHLFSPIFPCAHRRHVPGLLQMLLVHSQFSNISRYGNSRSLGFAEGTSGVYDVTWTRKRTVWHEHPVLAVDVLHSETLISNSRTVDEGFRSRHYIAISNPVRKNKCICTLLSGHEDSKVGSKLNN